MIERILIVGLGSIGKRHLKLARELRPDADIQVLRHQKSKEVPEFASGCLFHLEDALDFCPQIAIIANPASMHLDVAKPLAAKGVHLLIEKPLAASSEGVQSFLNTCAESKVVLMVGYNLRFLPSLQEFQRLLHKDRIGKILSVRCEAGQNLLAWRPDTDYRKTVSAQSKLGGGVLLELSHEIDYLRWIFGEISWVKASCSTQSNLEIDVEDTVHAILGFKTGNLQGTLNMDFIRHDTMRTCTAIGERGTLRWDALAGEVIFFEQGADQWQTMFHAKQQREDAYLAEWHHFLQCINIDQKPIVSGGNALDVLQIVDAIKSSSVSDTTEYITPW